jgi:hypothetical protein
MPLATAADAILQGGLDANGALVLLDAPVDPVQILGDSMTIEILDFFADRVEHRMDGGDDWERLPEERVPSGISRTFVLPTSVESQIWESQIFARTSNRTSVGPKTLTITIETSTDAGTVPKKLTIKIQPPPRVHDFQVAAPLGPAQLGPALTKLSRPALK